MEMDITFLDNDMECVRDESAEQLHASCSFLDEIFGDPQMIPRVGDQYQAEIPPLVGEYCSLQLVKEPIDSNVIMNVPNPFPMGLPIPLFWTKTEVESISGAFEFENSEERDIMLSDGCAEYKVESLDPMLGDEKDMRGYSKFQPTTKSKMDIDLLFPKEPKYKLNRVDRGTCPLPGSLTEVWKDIEIDSFLLGLYIFGKNLVLVKNFVESKRMGEILSFYYGKFYRSDGYCRWSECQKLRGRQCIIGQKLFIGWRQQELLSRLFCHLSKECQDMLLEVSKTFGEGKVSFEEYVFTIKNAVGIGILIEAIGIGKGKQDLTSNAMEPVKASHVVSFRPEIPVGKACSALTSADIIKFLTGDFRLSKARSSDLFWEAVWPRLLARGWHSEQPKDQIFSGSKNSLVFLIPGVKKFSRRRLVKGNHYFDSVSDVLNRVASEPGLLELEIEVPKISRENEENKWDPAIKKDPDFRSNKRNHYLKPQNSGCNHDLMKFTIVDTSFVRAAERSKVRDLRSLPLEATSLSTLPCISSDFEEDTSDDYEDELEENSSLHAAEAMAVKEECVDLSDCVNINSNIVIPHTSDTSIISVENHGSHHTSLLHDEGQKVVKHNFNQKLQSSDSKYLPPVTKEQGLFDCTNGDSSCSGENISSGRMLNEDNSHCRSNSPDAWEPDAWEDVVFQMESESLSPACSLSKGSPKEGKEGIVTENISSGRMLNEDNSHCRSNSPDACEDMVFQMESESFSPACSLSKGSPKEGKEGIVTENCQPREETPTITQLHTFIDFNVPQVSMDCETDGPFVTETVQNNGNSCAHISFFQSEITVLPEPLKLLDKGAEVNQHPIMHNRRQSTRNRPLTTKALEALECGFFSPKRKRRAAEVLLNNSPRVRGRPVVSAIFRNGAGNPNVEEN